MTASQLIEYKDVLKDQSLTPKIRSILIRLIAEVEKLNDAVRKQSGLKEEQNGTQYRTGSNT